MKTPRPLPRSIQGNAMFIGIAIMALLLFIIFMLSPSIPSSGAPRQTAPTPTPAPQTAP